MELGEILKVISVPLEKLRTAPQYFVSETYFVKILC